VAIGLNKQFLATCICLAQWLLTDSDLFDAVACIKTMWML